MKITTRTAALTSAAALVLAAGLPAVSNAVPPRQDGNQGGNGQGEGDGGGHGGHGHGIKHVLLISVDGMHQSDLRWYIGQHPDSTLARLVDRGVSYGHALTPIPSDSFPGMVGR